MTEQEFRQALSAEGYHETKVNEYQPGHGSDLHTHDFSARLLVLEGVFILGSDGADQVFAVGEVCSVPAGTRHAERTSAQAGARVLAGLKHPVGVDGGPV